MEVEDLRGLLDLHVLNISTFLLCSERVVYSLRGVPGLCLESTLESSYSRDYESLRIADSICKDKRANEWP